MNIKKVSEFFDNEYLDFAKYVVENRAIPSLIDGFKPTQRKVIHIANKIWKTGQEKPMKIFQLSGKVASDCYYHHGSSSLDQAIIGMSQGFKNSLPLMDGIGQFGSLRSPEAGAPRYISTKLHPNFRLIYNDFGLLDYKTEEGVSIEPKFFLPIIPTVLLNGSSGIAVGFATNILNRNPLDVIDACLDSLNNKPIKDINPWLSEFTGSFTRDVENKLTWKITGRFNIVNSTQVKVNEIPPNFTYERYEEHLNNLIEKKIIVDYDNLSKEKLEYVLKFNRATLKDLITKDKLSYVLKLTSQETENLTTIDENGKLKIFSRAEDIISYFVNFRLVYYERRKEFLLDSLNKKISILESKIRFISYFVQGKLKILAQSKDDIQSQLINNKFIKIEGTYNYLIGMPIYNLTQEKILEFEKELATLNDEMIYVKKTTPKEFYIKDLITLKTNLNKK